MRNRPIRWVRYRAGLLPGRNEMTNPVQAEAWAMEKEAMPPPSGCGHADPSLPPPYLPFHLFRLEVRVLLRPQAGGQVLPAAVGAERDDVAAIHPGGAPRGGAQDGARRYAREDAFVVHELFHCREGGARVHYYTPVQQRLVEDGRYEPLLQATQPLDEVARGGDGGDDLHVRVLLLQPAAHARERAAGAQPGHQRDPLREW